MPTPDDINVQLLSELRKGNLTGVLARLNAGAKVDVADARGETALHIAIRTTEYNYSTVGKEILAAFLNRGLDINTPDQAGASCFHYAVQNNTYISAHMTGDLLNFGADINLRDKAGRTPLHYAAMAGSGEGINFLLGIKADINASDEQGYTALHFAAAKGEAANINRLLKSGADIFARTRNGKTVWDAAVEGGANYQAQVLKAEALQREKAAAEKAREEVLREPPPKPKPHDPWSLLGDDRIAFSSIDRSIGYKLTEIFNFSARTYTQITHNIATKSEALVMRTFDEFSDKTPVEQAHAALERLGGRAERALINGPTLPKPSRNLKLPPNPQ